VILEVKGPNAFHIHYNHHKGTFFDETVTRDKIRDPDSPMGTEVSPDAFEAKQYPVERIKTTLAKSIVIGSKTWNLAIVDLPEKDEFEELEISMQKSPSGMFSSEFFMDADRTKLFYEVYGGSPHKPTILGAIDMKDGEVLGNATLQLKSNSLCGVSKDGNTLLTCSGLHWAHNNRFDLWNIGKEGDLIHLKGVATKDKLFTARFVADDHVALIDEKGVVTIWDVESTPKALYKTTSLGRIQTQPKVSLDRKHLYVSVNEKLIAIDVEKGKCDGSLVHGSNWNSVFAIHPARSKVAVAGNQSITVWNNKGQQLADFFIPSTNVSQLEWLDDRFLATGNSVIDTETMVELCTLDLAGMSKVDPRGILWSYDVHRSQVGAYKIDIDRLTAMTLEEFDPENLLASGTKVSIDITVRMPANERKSVEQSLTKMLEGRGLTVDRGANIEIQCSETTKKQTQEYRHTMTFSVEKATATVRNRKMALIVDGKELMAATSSSGGVPHMLSMRRGESVQQAVDRIGKNVNYEFFKKFSIPKVVYWHPNNQPFHKLKL